MDIFFGIIDSVIGLIIFFWWLILPLFLFYIFCKLWMIYIRTKFVNNLKWSLFEIKVPKDILKTPKAMEPVFHALIAMYSFGPAKPNVYIKGEVEPWMSLEMAGYDGEVHFYVYMLPKYRNLFESAVYAQYPGIEITEAEDYTELLASDLPNEVYDLWGTDFTLAKESYYPIRTYPFFEESQEEKRLDPIANITEIMSNLKKDEMIWLQILISPADEPTGNYWRREGEKKIEEISGIKSSKSKSKSTLDLGSFTHNLFLAPAQHPEWGKKKEEETSVSKVLNPFEQEAVKAISNKISKFGFETVIRFVYIDRRDSFTTSNFSAVIGAFNQFRTQDLNALRPNSKTITLKSGWKAMFIPRYKKAVELFRKKRLFRNYRTRKFGLYNKIRLEKIPVLNTEELATIYHFPTMMVQSSQLRKLDAKKVGPPGELPIEEN
ncbi:hypothetical protein JW698_00355 [Candidatus Wolfebacteria bacterium]|nr:hypothetical protein [Candidatus Wolfebacteria bacterium]